MLTAHVAIATTRELCGGRQTRWSKGDMTSPHSFDAVKNKKRLRKVTARSQHKKMRPTCRWHDAAENSVTQIRVHSTHVIKIHSLATK